MKTCTKCGERKDETAFRPRHSKDPSRLKSLCQACLASSEDGRRQANPGVSLVRVLSWKRLNPGSTRRSSFASGIWAKFGLRLEDYARMLDAQDHTCPGCGDELAADKYTHIDHDHETGTVRGLLCMDCNLVLGHVHDSPETLEALASYLRATQVAKKGAV